MRVARVVPSSLVNGDGIRTVIVFSGCSLGCKGCFSPELQKFHSGKLVEPKSFARKTAEFIDDSMIDGITLSGGNPTEQKEIDIFLEELKRLKPNLNIWCWSGHTFEEIKQLPKEYNVLPYVDVIIAGRFEQDKKCEGQYFGSTNQEIWRKINGEWIKDGTDGLHA